MEERTPAKIQKMTLEAALQSFGNEMTPPDQRREALSALIGEKFLPKQADDRHVLSGRDHLLRLASPASDDASRLLGIAELIRLTQVVKRWMPEVQQVLASHMADPIPPLSLLPDADDRLNVARACALFDYPWLKDYLAQSIASEEQGEKARAVLMEALFLRSLSVSEVLLVLENYFSKVRPTTEIPGDTVARRLSRTLTVFRGTLIESDLDAGEDIGNSLLGLVQGALSSVGRPEDDKAKIDLTREVVLTVHDIVRTRISVVASPSMYAPVGYCRRLFGSRPWPEELRSALDKLVTDVCEALLLLGRQGQCDQELLRQLDTLCNYPERARAIAKELASKHPELPEDVRWWLEKGKVRNSQGASDTAIELAAGNADASLGLVLQSARLARQTSANLRERIVSCLELYEPVLAGPTDECLKGIVALAVQVEQTASQRRLELYGTPGEEIEFSAKFFEVVGGMPRQRMVVKQPAVVKVRSDGTAGDVVLKGLVE